MQAFRRLWPFTVASRMTACYRPRHTSVTTSVCWHHKSSSDRCHIVVQLLQSTRIQIWTVRQPQNWQDEFWQTKQNKRRLCYRELYV